MGLGLFITLVYLRANNGTYDHKVPALATETVEEVFKIIARTFACGRYWMGEQPGFYYRLFLSSE